MPGIEIFLDSSALIAGIISSHGAARALMLLAEDKRVTLIVSEQVVAEVERNLARKAPKALPYSREMIRLANIRIVPDPEKAEITRHLDWISHPADVPILVAAAHARVGYLATLNTRHFIDDPQVTHRSGLRIGTPGDALAWARSSLSQGEAGGPTPPG